MCTGGCSKCIAISLYVLAVVSIFCNIMLFFPDFKTEYAEVDREGLLDTITEEVKYMGGLVGGGVMVLIPAIHIHLTSADKCCSNRCGMFLSIGFAAVGALGAVYSLAVAALGLANGPTCLYVTNNVPLKVWGTPFKDSEGNYLSDPESWARCTQPKNVVQFNIGLFVPLLLTACAELILCLVQMINGLFGCLCGTCTDKDAN